MRPVIEDLAAFLKARLDEDEQDARSLLAVAQHMTGRTRNDDPAWVSVQMMCVRALRDVEAKRELITFAFENAAQIDGEWGDGHEAGEIAAGLCTDHGAKAALRALRPLVNVYSNHHGYREEWARETA